MFFYFAECLILTDRLYMLMLLKQFNSSNHKSKYKKINSRNKCMLFLQASYLYPSQYAPTGETHINVNTKGVLRIINILFLLLLLICKFSVLIILHSVLRLILLVFSHSFKVLILSLGYLFSIILINLSFLS